MAYGIFLSYRRSDTSGHAGRICDDLNRHFRRTLVFRDIDAIPVGVDFVQALEKAIGEARVAIVLIGDGWLNSQAEDGSRRLDDPQDHVRRELAMALADDRLSVIPVLVEGAAMPDEQELPGPLRPLARLQAMELSEERWDHDMARLGRVLEEAGVQRNLVAGLSSRTVTLLGVLLAALVLGPIWYRESSSLATDRYTGLWYLPNGSFWTVVEREGRLWVDETHYDSRQVWKRGPAAIDGDGLSAELELVFERKPFRYLVSLRSADDRQTLSGSVRRSDQGVASPLVLTRDKP